MRQPPYPFPAELARGVGEEVDPQVVGGVQGRGLGHQPASGGPAGVGWSGQPDHLPFWQRDGQRHLLDEWDDRPPVLVLLRVAQFDRGRQVGRPHPEQQVVRVGAAALPQAAARPGRDRQDRARVGTLLAPGGPLRVERVGDVALDARLMLGVLAFPGRGRLLAVPAFGQRAADQQHGGQARHRQQIDLVQEVGHGHAQHQRQDGHEDGQRAAFGGGRGSRQGDPGGPRRRQQPRRPVEVDARPVRRPGQRGARQHVRDQADGHRRGAAGRTADADHRPVPERRLRQRDLR